MRLGSRAALAAALLGCASPALADSDSHWLTDPASNCAVFDANAKPGDVVRWSGDCVDGRADGPGTAAFTSEGAPFESFTGTFANGVAQDGHVVVHWGKGWTYDGNDVHGQFNGAGVLTNDSQDRFEGNWIDGKMNGHGTLTRANGEQYQGEWKDDVPNGEGLLKRANGSTVEGIFADGKLVEAKSETAPDAPPESAAAQPMVENTPADKPADKPSPIAPAKPAQAALPKPAQAAIAKPPQTVPVKTANSTVAKPAEKPAAALAPRGFESISGKILNAIDGSHIALTLIEGGIEREIVPAGGAPQKTTFTFMNDRLGTVVEDGGPAAGANVTGFFRLTDTGVEVRYADGRSENLTAGEDGGVRLATVSVSGEASCRAWYPEGHVFSEEEKKAALAAYASKLGLAAPAVKSSSCHAAAPPVATVKPSAKPSPSHTAFQPSRGKLGNLQPVAVRESVIHTIDAFPPASDALPGPAALAPMGDPQDAAQCLKVDSDGHEWGFRNSCGFAVQFAYCLMHGGERLTDCGDGQTANSVTGSVAAGGFGALSADRSLSEKDVDHDYRWFACGGGAGEVVARLDRAEPPGGHCDRAEPLTADAH